MPTFLSGDWAVWKQTFSESKSLRTHNTSLYVINSVRRNEQENKFLRQKNSCVSQFFVYIPYPDVARRDSHEVAFEKNQVTADS